MKEHGSETPARGGDADSCLEAVTIPLKFGGSLHDLRASSWKRIRRGHNPAPTDYGSTAMAGTISSASAEATSPLFYGLSSRLIEFTTFSGPHELSHT
jgi:hypothetical protein